MPRLVHHVTDPEDGNERADVVLGRRIGGLSRRVARMLALRGHLKIDGRTCAPATRVRLGQQLELTTEDGEPAREVTVLRATPDYLYINKPSGLHTHRLGPHSAPSLADNLARLHPECTDASADPREGGALHRLDRDTTGVVVFARTRSAWDRGREALSGTDTFKLYLALCDAAWPLPWPPKSSADTCPAPALEPWPPWPPGILPDNLPLPAPPGPVPVDVHAPLGRGSDRGTVKIRADGLVAHSSVVPLAYAPRQDGHATVLVAAQLHTGRRHQVRAHLASLGLPILGDPRYGGPPGPLCLHCASLQLPFAEQSRVDAPVFGHMAAALMDLTWQSWAGFAPPW